MENSVKAMYSERGRTLLLYKNFTFTHYRKVKSTDEQGWRCSNKENCNAKSFTIGSDHVLSRCVGNHIHVPSSVQEIGRESVSNAIKRKAEDDMNERSAKLINKELEEQSDMVSV